MPPFLYFVPLGPHSDTCHLDTLIVLTYCSLSLCCSSAKQVPQLYVHVELKWVCACAWGPKGRPRTAPFNCPTPAQPLLALLVLRPANFGRKLYGTSKSLSCLGTSTFLRIIRSPFSTERNPALYLLTFRRRLYATSVLSAEISYCELRTTPIVSYNIHS